MKNTPLEFATINDIVAELNKRTNYEYILILNDDTSEIDLIEMSPNMSRFEALSALMRGIGGLFIANEGTSSSE